MKHLLCLLLGLLLASTQSFANTDTVVIDESALLNLYASYENYVDSITETLPFQGGEIDLDGIATIHVPQKMHYLNGEKSEFVLTDIWGNPPSDSETRSLGMLFEKDSALYADKSYAINFIYVQDGHVLDDDAKKLDYDDLLKTMKKDTEEASEWRQQEGYEAIELIGWASPPFYDEVNKKLHWAKEIKFGDNEENTLNYNIRVLGRRGYLEMNVIAGMQALPHVKDDIDMILSSVEFQEGHRYEDFDSNLDEVAAYGIGGLIAGKVLLKAGILAKLGILLAKFWKIILIGIVAVGAGFRKFFGKKDGENPKPAA